MHRWTGPRCTLLVLTVSIPFLSSGAERRDLAAAQPPAPTEAASPATSSPSPASPALSPRNANYSMVVRLDPASRTLRGHLILTWRNISRVTATELQFHLYYNAWRNTASTWMRERLLRGDETGAKLASRPAEDWGWIDLTAIRLLAEGAALPIDLTGQQRFIAPDDGNEADRTVMAVTLPRTVAPGETINIELEWDTKVPRTFARTGAIDDFFFIAQWFPKIGVLTDSGWNCHQFHAATEFFSDYGVYDVRIIVPRAWVVGATGAERDRRDNPDASTTHHYYQEDVHDFAWTTSPDYIEREARFERPGLPGVRMRLLLQPEHAGQADRHFAATRAALRYYGEWFGPYPYNHITIVDPAWQSDAGGMEYPTLFTAGTRWLVRDGVVRPEGVTIHEAGHQFWYGIVGNNEFEHAWLDEGFNSFSDARVTSVAYEPNYLEQRFFGELVPWVFRDIPLDRIYHDGWPRYREAAESDTQSAPTYRYWPVTHARISYDKTALWLHTLERHIGWPALQRVMSAYFRRWKFRHPQPGDFFAVANEVTGKDLTWFFDQVHRSSNVFDYGVEVLTSEPVQVRGFTGGSGQQLQFQSGAPSSKQFHTDVVVRRYGEAVFPVDLLVAFGNGEKIRQRWDGRDRWKKYDYDGPARAEYAVVDPDRVLVVDVNFTNNSRTLAPTSREASRKWMLKWLTWVQDLMLTYGFLI
ncbi:MAG: M1 family peptidase [Acidobacteria bacterium]|nr:M1 family peptidase [Acidobacteriota bacterium]